MSEVLEQLLWEKVDKSQLSPGGCWEWIGGKISAGYGVLYHLKQPIYTHRLSYVIAYGAIPEGALIRHRCDNPPCVNPAHLLTGTKADNARDVVNRGMSSRKECRSAKLTEDKVLEIRALYATGEYTQRALGEQFGVDQALISRVIHRQRW